jgi:CubicO group peptidase (beta-lactamase class C family)
MIILSIYLGSFTAAAQTNSLTAEALMYKLINDNVVAGIAAGYSVNDTVIWQSSAGYADIEKKIKIETTTKLRIASIAKPMTAIAIMQLVEKGLLDLDEPIQRYIPDFPKQQKTQITTRQLLSHTSGIDDYKNTKEAQTTKEYDQLSAAVDVFKNRKLLFEPGTQYAYTTYGYTVLGLIIEKLSGQTYGEYMKTNIWDRAQMYHTGVDQYGSHEENSSQLYHRKKKGKIEKGTENNLSNRIPGGGFYSTLEDMLKFGNAVLNNTLIKEETLQLMRAHHSLEKENNAYGFGWYLYYPKPNEGAIIGHNGEQTGCSAQLFIIPTAKTVAVALANTSMSGKEVSTLANDLMGLSQKRD